MEKLANFIAACNFDTPIYFWIAAILILLLIFLPWTTRKRRLSVDLHYLKRKLEFRSNNGWVLVILVVIVSTLMSGILSGFQSIKKSVTYVYGYPAMLLVDVSGSMGVDEKTHKTGYEESLEAFNSLVSRRGDINYSLMIFSAENYVARYFINKNELFIDTLENKEDIVEISQGTRITEALEKARKFIIDNINSNDRAIILVSDLNVTGSSRLDLIKEMVKVSLSDINLYIVATGGSDQRITDIPEIPNLKIVGMADKTSLDEICREISSTHMSPIREEENILKSDLTPIFILPALVLISFYLILSETRYRKIP
jgi:hypothetical protein